MKILELKGYKSLRALNAFHALMLGLKMLPTYVGETYEDFFSRVEAMDEHSQEKLIREAALFVELAKEEVEAMVCFACDPNGVPYTAENVKNLNPAQILEVVVAVCMQIARMKISIVSEDEKKNLEISA